MEGRPFVSRLKHTRLSLYQVQATKGGFYQAMSYLLDNEEEKQFKRPEAVKIITLIITIPTRTTHGDGARFHMHSLLLESINLADRQVKHRRKGYADFLSSSDCTDSDINEKVDEIIGGIEVIDIIELI
jgi:hypothetical protein